MEAAIQKNDARVAVVTGGMGGLGTALCRRLARDGMSVVATYSPGNSHVADWLAEQEQQGFAFKAFCLDVADYSSCCAAVSQIVTDVGVIDVLVNNAGITRDASMRKMTLNDWQAVLHTDLDSIFHMTKQVLDRMVERGWGRVINISSVNGQKGAFGQANYSAAKAGIHGFTKAVALEVANKGVTVNTVSPGYLRTRMVEKVSAEIMKTKILPQIPAGRLGEPDEVAALVGFLASNEAAYITGANIAINGGLHMY
ncbi:acetoacetyl-CoA reductase [Pusillimonas sp.]|uniref:acetoacetyl-CoA reductase n=1 Tax=Pusillimonas sp. TaxID=3040095 RepID=UPI0029B1382C|nr:acetoacetyl-CoA reductase [Pusillimonas sp.]MDX3893206.1 acetoacetyl-CoA reductase [Pusillimonas sp.]